MTREDAKQWFINPEYKMLRETKITSTFMGKSQEQAIDKIFDAHEAELKALVNEKNIVLENNIKMRAELNELKNRTCEGCKYFGETEKEWEEGECPMKCITDKKNEFCYKWEKKDV